MKGATRQIAHRALQAIISIHAPVKGATRGEINFLMLPLISIHAPVKGATSCICLQSSSKINFNPRSREGSD